MNINIICIGKLKEKYLKDAVDEYSKRLTRFANLQIIELPDEKIPERSSDKIEEKILKKEGELILSKLKKDSFIIAMCVEGKLISSEELAATIKNVSQTSSNITFIIGGSLGLSDSVKKCAHTRISFGKITLPHQLMRVILLEQIYRAFRIMKNEPYHK